MSSQQAGLRRGKLSRHTSSVKAIIVPVHKASSTVMKTTCLAVIALSLWLGGMGCALCCATGLTESCCLNRNKATAESDCCKRAKCESIPDNTKAALRSAREIGCTLLPNQSAGLAIVPRITDEAAIQVPAPNIYSALITGLYPSSRAVDPPSPLNRGGTYLLCCALLI
jgi:hypothetical protein